jgi:hypothetical protein
MERGITIVRILPSNEGAPRFEPSDGEEKHGARGHGDDRLREPLQVVGRKRQPRK